MFWVISKNEGVQCMQNFHTVLFLVITHAVMWQDTNVSEDHTLSIFRVKTSPSEMLASYHINTSLYGVITQKITS
jgi:hypothetical protein